jgi:hypothetical protein
VFRYFWFIFSADPTAGSYELGKYISRIFYVLTFPELFQYRICRISLHTITQISCVHAVLRVLIIFFNLTNQRKLDNNLLTVEPRAVEPHCFDADPEPEPDPAQNLDADPHPDPDPGGGGVGQPKMCIPPGKILGTPLVVGLPASTQRGGGKGIDRWKLPYSSTWKNPLGSYSDIIVN